MATSFLKSDISDSLERRLFERFVARFPTKMKDADEDFGENFFLRDVSASGAKVFSRQKMLLEEYLSLNVELPDSAEPVCLNGYVRWVKSQTPSIWEVGIEFEKIDLMRMHRMMKHLAVDSGNVPS